jgi:hypothetical protein
MRRRKSGRSIAFLLPVADWLFAFPEPGLGELQPPPSVCTLVQRHTLRRPASRVLPAKGAQREITGSRRALPQS